MIWLDHVQLVICKSRDYDITIAFLDVSFVKYIGVNMNVAW